MRDEEEYFKGALESADPDLRPAAAAFQLKHESEKDGRRIKTAITVHPDDIVAFFAGVIALLFGISMIVGWVPINKWTIGVITLSGVTPGLAKIAAARSRKRTNKPPEIG